MTRVFYRPIRAPEQELTFVKWEPKNDTLVVIRPRGMRHAGREWRFSRRKLSRWLKNGRIRLEGDRPEWAKEQK